MEIRAQQIAKEETNRKKNFKIAGIKQLTWKPASEISTLNKGNSVNKTWNPLKTSVAGTVEREEEEYVRESRS